MIDKIFDKKSRDPVTFEDLHAAMLEASDVAKLHFKSFDIIAYILILASGKSIAPQERGYFDFLAMDFDFRRVLKRMRKDPKVPCAGETILDEILAS
jgi:hypothetical protein